MAKSGKNKLKITGYSKDTFSNGDKAGEYSVRYNPTTIDHTFDLVYDEVQAVGSSASENKYRYTKPETISFDLIFDNTFVAEDDNTNYDVDKMIKDFKKVVVDFDGSIHRPNYVRLAWGKITFKGQLQSLSFSYSAFTADGYPLKATAKVTFMQVMNIKERLAEENKSSPDLTHIITLKEGDTLPGLCNKIYANPGYYLEVARINKLDGFRKLNAGDRIVMPPLER